MILIISEFALVPFRFGFGEASFASLCDAFRAMAQGNKWSGVVFGSDGRLYGSTNSGESHGAGVLYQI